MNRTAQETIEDFYAASETRNKPGTGVPSWRNSWRPPAGSLYSVTLHREEIEEDRQWAAEKATLEAHKVSLEDKILAALQSGNRVEARELIAKHYRSNFEESWCGDPFCCS